MSTHLYYLLVNLGCLVVPLLFSFHPKLRFYKEWRAYAVGTILMMLVFIPWDIHFTDRAIWGFDRQYVSGPFLLGLPVEEWLFFVCIPYACTFTYSCFRKLVRSPIPEQATRILAIGIAIACLLIAVSNLDKAYTFWAHLLCALLLGIHILILRKNYLSWFLLMFGVILLPFIVFNGILTGLEFWTYPLINTQPELVSECIVWYNNAENLGIRIFSMPVDDLAYGMLMLLLVITGFEWYRERAASVQ